MDWTEIETTFLVEASHDPGIGGDRYRFWDVNHAVPSPEDGVIRAQVYLTSGWEELKFNRSWRKNYLGSHSGTWLKQKASKRFTTTVGQENLRVRYQRIDEPGDRNP